MLTLYILLQCIAAVISQGTLGPKYENPNLIRVGGFPRPTLQIPLDIKIETESEFEQCQSNSTYCYSVQSEINQEVEQIPTGCPSTAPNQSCQQMRCTGESEPLENFKTPVDFLITRELLEPIGQLPDRCGLTVSQSSLEFKGIIQPEDSPSECPLPALQPSVSLNASSLGHSLMFDLQITEAASPSANP